MMIGYNNDVEYRGEEFHIQTEDHGEAEARIESQIFHEGQILDTKNVSYEAVRQRFAGDERDQRLESMMWSTHKEMYKNLLAGEYDELAGLEPLSEQRRREVLDAPDPDAFEPSQDRVPSSAKMVEEHGEEAFEQFHQQEAQKHVTLGEVKEKLGERSAGGAGGSSGAEDGETIDASEVDEAVAEASDGGTDEIDIRGIESEGRLDREAEPSGAPADSGITRDGSGRSGGQSRAENGAALQEERGTSSTDASAWRGCRAPDDDLAIDTLVERALS